MEPDKIKESTQLAAKLYQAVLSLKPGEYSTERHVHRMGQALALAESMAASASGSRRSTAVL